MMRVGVLIGLALSASGAVAQEAVYGSHQHPAVRIAQGGGAAVLPDGGQQTLQRRESNGTDVP